jgi:hypothetical protein
MISSGEALKKAKEKAEKPLNIALIGGLCLFGALGIWHPERATEPKADLKVAYDHASRTVGRIVLEQAKAENIPGNIQKDKKHHIERAIVSEQDGHDLDQIVVTMRTNKEGKADPDTTFRVLEVKRDGFGKKMKYSLSIINNSDRFSEGRWGSHYSDFSGDHPINNKNFIKSEDANERDNLDVAGRAVLFALGVSTLNRPAPSETSNSPLT